jgi:hypothetical protein
VVAATWVVAWAIAAAMMVWSCSAVMVTVFSLVALVDFLEVELTVAVAALMETAMVVLLCTGWGY